MLPSLFFLLFGGTAFLISYNIYKTSRKLGNYNLDKDYFPMNISNVTISPDISINSNFLDKNKIIDNKNEYIKEFSNFLVNNYNLSDLKYFFNNLNNFKIVYGSPNNYDANYNFNNNEIEVNEKNIKDTIYHELFHMASTYKLNNEVYSGFSQIKNEDEVIGIGLNEGYTDYLSTKYFDKENKSTIIYKSLVALSRYIENIVGKDNMETFYLNANLKELILELNKYIDYERIDDLIKKMDIFYLKYNKFNKINDKLEKKLVKDFLEIKAIIDEIYENKNCYNENIKKN